MKPDYVVGLDLGQARDYTAIAVMERTKIAGTDRYGVSHLARMQAPYPEVVRSVAELLRAIDSRDRGWINDDDGRGYLHEPDLTLVIDGTGVGVAVVDLFREADLPGKLVAMTITGGDNVSRDGDSVRVPKRDLAGVVQVLLQSQRLKIAQALPLASTLQGELLNFRVKISLTGHDSYGAGADWRSANHDDLVLAVAMACWHGEANSGPLWSDNIGAFFRSAFGES
jgi:hypothetical protein